MGLTMPQAATIPAFDDGEDMTEQPTTGLFQALRILSGMTLEETALALGGLPRGEVEVRNLEKSRTFFVYKDHLDTLAALVDRMEAEIDDHINRRESPPPFLITYAIDPDFAQWDHELQEWMVFASVHRMFTARLWLEWRALGFETTVIHLAPADYIAFLQSTPTWREDSEAARMEWAARYVENYRLRESPPVTEGAEEAIAARLQFHRRDGSVKDVIADRLEQERKRKRRR
jgi:hypothetical protein